MEAQINSTDDNSETVDYYTVLGITRDANKNDIQRAYRKLASTFHPDRFLDETLNQQAQLKFLKIKKAYEILQDDEKRRLYDIYGPASEKFEVGSALKTHDELVREISRMRKYQYIQYLDRRVNLRGQIIASFAVNKLNGMFISESLILPFQDGEVKFAGHANNLNRSSSNLDVSILKKCFDQRLCLTSGVIFDSLGLSPYAGWSFMLSGGIGQIGCNLSCEEISNPQLKIFGTRSIGDHVSGTVSLNLGAPQVSTSLNAEYDEWQAGIKLAFEPKTIKLFTEASRNIGNRAAAKSNLELSVQGEVNRPILSWVLNCRYERRLSQLIHGFVGFGIGTMGVYLQTGFTRLGQTFNFPILISQKLTWQSCSASVLFPFLVSFFAHVLFFEPRRRKKLELKKERKLQLQLAKINAEKQKAKIDCLLIADEVMRRREEEENKSGGGLIILQAFYGRPLDQLDTEDVPEDDPYRVDVTVPLQYLVQNSKLEIPAESEKSSLIGFYDPDPDQLKYIEVVYLFRNNVHRVIIDETQSLRIPLSSHKMNTD